MGSLESMTTLVKLVFTVGVFAAILWFVVRPLIRTWQQQPDAQALMPKLPDLPEEELQIPSDPNERRKPDRNQMINELRADPQKTAMVLKQWIAEKERGRKRKPQA
jgi:flagellar biosynthesis/type III secretory pathway M-ring protein FliF/YscJ